MFAYSSYFLYHEFYSYPPVHLLIKKREGGAVVESRSSGNRWPRPLCICLKEWGMWTGAVTLSRFQLPFWDIWKTLFLGIQTFFHGDFLSKFRELSSPFSEFYFSSGLKIISFIQILFYILRSFKIDDFSCCLCLL